MAFVSVEPYSGTLRRYEQVDRGMVRLTHMATQCRPAVFSVPVVRDFLERPDPRFAVTVGFDPDPSSPFLAALGH